MKYLGLIEVEEDIATKDYVDNALQTAIGDVETALATINTALGGMV
jgi:hypothetical protein